MSSFNGWVKLMADRVKFMELRQPHAGFAFFSRLATEFLNDLVIVFRSEWMSLKLRFVSSVFTFRALVCLVMGSCLTFGWSPQLHADDAADIKACLLYTSPSPRDATLSRMPSSA